MEVMPDPPPGEKKKKKKSNFAIRIMIGYYQKSSYLMKVMIHIKLMNLEDEVKCIVIDSHISKVFTNKYLI